MLRGSLFERLRGTYSKKSISDDEILYSSIVSNLSNLLSSNIGNAQTVPNYGKVDLNNIDLSPTASQKHIEKELLKSINLFEKRLVNVKVSVLKNRYDVSTMSIFIDGQFSIKGELFDITIKAKIHGDGSIK
ncbi:MAG TPA: type VI secretion system baseplate subunit TssE, partial [Campylobacterales bacterium]|nr:type VI secretion system baseplate subunit TssE [Campylobacterales bacterium]